MTDLLQFMRDKKKSIRLLSVLILPFAFSECQTISGVTEATATVVQPTDSRDTTANIDALVDEAKAGNPHSQYKLGLEYEEIDIEEANKWFQLSAEQGYVPAQYMMALNCLGGIGV